MHCMESEKVTCVNEIDRKGAKQLVAMGNTRKKKPLPDSYKNS